MTRENRFHERKRSRARRTAVALGMLALPCATLASTASTVAGAATKSKVTSNSFVEAKAAALAATRPKGLRVPKETIGLVNVLYASTAAQRIQAGAVQAAHALGWKILTVDANGNPSAMESGVVGFVNQHVSAILDLSNATEAITQGLAAAHAAHIPVIDIGGVEDPSPNLTAQYTENEVQLGTAMANYLIDHLKRGAHVAIDEYPLLLAIRIREAIVVNRLKQAGDHVAVHQSDFANLVNDTQSATQAQVAADPNLSAIVGETDTEMPVIDQVLKQHGLCHQILNLNLYDDPQNLQIIRSGCLAADVTEPPGVYGFFAVDQLAQMFARHLPESSLAKSIQVLEKKWGIDLVGGPSTVTVTKANVPPPGKFVAPTYNYVKFFTTAWHSEFRGVAIQSSIQN